MGIVDRVRSGFKRIGYLFEERDYDELNGDDKALYDKIMAHDNSGELVSKYAQEYYETGKQTENNFINDIKVEENPGKNKTPDNGKTMSTHTRVKAYNEMKTKQETEQKAQEK